MTNATRTIHSRPYGEISVHAQQAISFPRGLFGFEELHEYVLLDSSSPPFYWLQSTAKVEPAFVVVNPYLVAPQYVLDIAEEDLEAIGSPPPDSLLVFVIVTIPSDGDPVTCNLQGPIVINRKTRVARQAISLDQSWRIKHVLSVRED